MIHKILLILLTFFASNSGLYGINHNFKYTNLYIGNQIGLSNYTNLKQLSNNLKYIKTNIKNNNLGYGNFLGYKINKNFNLELGYNNFGKVYKKSKFVSGFFITKGITLCNKFNYNIINKTTNLYTKIGWMILKSQAQKSNIINHNKETTSYVKMTPLTSIGIEFNINKNWITRLDYQWTYNVGHRNYLYEEPNNNLLTFNIIYKISNLENFNLIKKYFIYIYKIYKNFNLNIINKYNYKKYINNYKNKYNRNNLNLINIFNYFKYKNLYIINIKILNLINNKKLILNKNLTKINPYIKYIIKYLYYKKIRKSQILIKNKYINKNINKNNILLLIKYKKLNNLIK